MLDIKIYNAKQIGGCFTVIQSEQAKIMIDYGQILPGTKSRQEEFDWENDTVDAVFITHYHGDHVGRMLEIPDYIPIYMGMGTRTILLNIHERLTYVEELKVDQEKLVKLLKSDRVNIVVENQTITDICGIKITPYSVDHSAYDAYMYLVEADGEVALHTGDFRGHGYRGSKMLDVIKYYIHKNGREVDYLITEGTMMGDRKDEKVKTEEELYAEAKELFCTHKYVFLVISSTNLDSLSSFYRAARKNGMCLYCYSSYLFKQLKSFSSIAGKWTLKYLFKDIYTVQFDKKLGEKIWGIPKTQEELMREHGFLCIIKPEDKYAEWIERFKDKKPLVIYSLWNGYLNPKYEAYNPNWSKFFESYKQSGQFRDMHTSGHATAEMIASVIEAVNPQKRIYPMHTENIDGFKELEIDDYFKQIIEE